MQRYFLTEAPVDGRFALDDETQHHFMTVLRGKVGSQAEFALPDRQTVVIAEVSTITDGVTTMQVVAEQASSVELPVETTLVLALSKGDKPEWVVQKATELGVHHIVLVETAWSVVRWGDKAPKKLARLAKVAQGAAEQSHRLVVPDVTYVGSLSDLMLPEASVRLVAWEESAKQGEQQQLAQVFSQLTPGTPVVGLVGPEGGLAPDEIELLQTRYGFQPAGLGPRILRAETAPLYFMSALSYALELKG